MTYIYRGGGYWCLTLHQQYFSYIVVVSFIGGGNQSTQTKPTTYHKCIEYPSPWARFKHTTLVVIGTDWTGSCKSNYHTVTEIFNEENNLYPKNNMLLIVFEVPGSFFFIEISCNLTSVILTRLNFFIHFRVSLPDQPKIQMQH